MSDQQQHLLAFVQDGSVESAITNNPAETPASSTKRQLRLMKALKKSHTLSGPKQARPPTGKARLKSGYSLEKQTWKLNYQDFLPTPLPSNSKATDGYWEKSENFQKLVDRANNWLKKNVGVQLKSCETITCSSRDRVKMASWSGNDALSSRSLAENSSTYFTRGLRLWLGPAWSDEDREQQVSFFDIIPEVESRISDLVVMVNKRIDEKQLKGRVISVDTISCPLYKNTVHSTATRWLENVDQDWPNAYVLRTFFVKSPPRKHSKTEASGGSLGLKDFQPKKTSHGYEGFEVLVEKANNFMKQQVKNNINVDLCNLQSVLIYKNQDPGHESGPYCYFTTPGLNNLKPVEIFRVLRLCYFAIPSVPGQQSSSSPSAMLFSSKLPSSYKFSTITYETFVPEFYSRKTEDEEDNEDGGMEKLEMMDELFSHVTQFLQTYDTEVMCVETVVNPIQMYYGQDVMRDIIRGMERRKLRHQEEEDDDDYGDCMFFIFTFRLFLTSTEGTSKGLLPPYQLPATGGTSEATMVQVIQPQSQQAAEKERDKEGHAPLFLRNVVGRQFKYRWLALALSAFTCMAIIVSVSVIYSNK